MTSESERDWKNTMAYGDEHAEEFTTLAASSANLCDGEMCMQGSTCPAQDKFFSCTLLQGHSGPHIACGARHNLHIWSNEGRGGKLNAINTLTADLPTLQAVVDALRSAANESDVDGSVLLDRVADALAERIYKITTTGGPVEGD